MSSPAVEGHATERERPAGGLLHPVVPIALIVLLVNDHVLKAAAPGLISGKLSDVAGLVLTPLVLQAAWELGQWATGRWTKPSRRILAGTILLVGLGFSAVQVWPPATEAWSWGLGAAQAPFRALASLLLNQEPMGLQPVQTTADAGDLLTLPALGLSWWAGRRRAISPARGSRR